MEKSISGVRNDPVRLVELYRMLLDDFGPQEWWPGETSFEVAVGAILTQNTNWGNAEKAIANLKRAGTLTPEKMERLSRRRLATLIRPAGYFNVKAGSLANFLKYLRECHGLEMEGLRRSPGRKLRQELLAIKGIGPETADSILLYGAGKLFFVVDAYTRRIFHRHGHIREKASYDEVRELFVSSLPRSVNIYNEFHALIVRLGKEFCRPRQPRCRLCPLGPEEPPAVTALSFPRS